MFFSYRMRLNEPVFYFVLDEDKPKTDVWHAIVIYIDADGTYHVVTSDNPGDEEMSWNEIEQHQPKLKGLKGIFKHIPLTAEEKADYEKLGEPVKDNVYDNLSYTEKEKYIGFGHDLTEKQLENTPKQLIGKYAATTTGENMTKEMVKSLPPSDQKVLKDNRIKRYGNVALFKYYPEDLKDGMTIDGDLVFKGDSSYSEEIEKLPKNLKIKGNLIIRYLSYISLPKGLKIEKNLHLTETILYTLPDDLYVGGKIFMHRHSEIEEIPDNLKDKIKNVSDRL
jgi:hypothetical protein